MTIFPQKMYRYDILPATGIYILIAILIFVMAAVTVLMFVVHSRRDFDKVKDDDYNESLRSRQKSAHF